MATDDGSTKLMAAANTGRLIRVPIDTTWVSEVIVTTSGTRTGR